MVDGFKSPSSTKACAYCSSSIPIEAKLCPTCRSYQSPWRSAIIYAAGIAGLLSLVGSAGAFIMGKIPDLYKMIAWRDKVKVFDFETGLYPEFTVSLSNIGDGQIMVSQIFIILPDGYNVGYRISETLAPGGSITRAGSQVFPPDYGGYIYNRSGIPNETILKNAGSPWPEQNMKPCFGEIMFIENSFLLNRMRSKIKNYKLVEKNIDAFVIYYSLHNGSEVMERFPVVVTFVLSSEEKCGRLNYED